MDNWIRWALLLSIVGTVATLGCAGASTRRPANGQQSSAQGDWSRAQQANGNPSRDNQPGMSANAPARSAGTFDRATSAASSVGRSVSGAFKTATHRVSDALEVKPAVTPVSDSVRLSSMPGQLSPLLYVRGAAFSESKGNMAGAQQQYEKALEMDPRNITTLIAYARFRDRIGDSNQALEAYQRARSVEPNNATVWNDLALCHARRSEVDAALGAMQQAVALRPDNVRYRNNLAAVLVQADRPEDAVRELQKVHSPAVANHNVACLLLRLRNQPLAAEHLRRAVSLDPSFQRAQMMLARLEAAGSTGPHEQRGDGQNAPLTPPGRPVESRPAVDPTNVPNRRNSQWETSPRNADYGSNRQPGLGTDGPERFPRVEP